ncbi:MAG: hypothetical protein RBR23_00655 [Arcobacteraceae bacterium]|jgi:hypothetical protein|nr:hypothetical protein [Arcobacteraceae bacterium]
MENLQVIEVLWRYATIIIVIIMSVYLFTSFLISRNSFTHPTINFITNEIHIFLRSFLIVIVAFLFAKYMFLVEIGAYEYFKYNPSHEFSDYFNYIVDLASKAKN